MGKKRSEKKAVQIRLRQKQKNHYRRQKIKGLLKLKFDTGYVYPWQKHKQLLLLKF